MKLLTLDEVAIQLGVTLRQLRRLRDGGDPLPVVQLNRKTVRVHPDDLANWVDRRRCRPVEITRGSDSVRRRDSAGDAVERCLPRGGRPLNSQRQRLCPNPERRSE